jgi:hypothetical protein
MDVTRKEKYNNRNIHNVKLWYFFRGAIRPHNIAAKLQ